MKYDELIDIWCDLKAKRDALTIKANNATSDFAYDNFMDYRDAIVKAMNAIEYVERYFADEPQLFTELGGK